MAARNGPAGPLWLGPILALQFFSVPFTHALLYHPYFTVEDYDAGPGKRKLGDPYSDMQLRELNEQYEVYENMSSQAKNLFAASLGIPKRSIDIWMARKRRKVKEMAETTQQYQMYCEQMCSLKAAGIHR